MKKGRFWGLFLLFTGVMALTVVGATSTKVNASTTFAKGADVSWLSEMEYYNWKFYNDSGTASDCLQILADHGINSIRLRLWVNPSINFSNESDVLTMAKRASDMGFRIMLDIHYSDTWADPDSQAKPSAWSGLSYSSLKSKVYSYTKGVMQDLEDIGVTPEWVQIGNETNDGFLWEDGRASTNMKQFAALITQGYKAVKAVSSDTKVVVHISNGYNNTLFRWIFDGLTTYSAQYDVIGMSLYPESSTWSTLNTQCLTNMKDMISRYGKEVMICEVGMSVNSASACKSFLADLITKTKSVDGLGVFYWEPESYGSWYAYYKGVFDSTGKPTVALDAFQ